MINSLEKLEIVKDCGEAAVWPDFPLRRRARRRENRNSFELYSEYTAKKHISKNQG